MCANWKMYLNNIFLVAVLCFAAQSCQAEDYTNLAMQDGELEDHIERLVKRSINSCPVGIRCVPLIQCPAHIRLSGAEKPLTCNLASDVTGYCCLSGQNHTSAAQARTTRRKIVSMAIIIKAIRQIKKSVRKSRGQLVLPGQPEYLHSMFFHSPAQSDKDNYRISNAAMEQIIATQMMVKKLKIPVEDIITNKMNIDFRGTPMEKHCPRIPNCPDSPARYRPVNGMCNNPKPKQSHWGAAEQPLERLLPPKFEDGIWKMRLNSSGGQALPSARRISRLLLRDINCPHPRHNLLLMQLGQFVSHDVAHTDLVRDEEGGIVRCCKSDGSGELPPEQLHFACQTIPVEPDDEFYGEFGLRCLNFVRLSLSPSYDCKASYAKARNEVTHFLDASTVYGSNADTTAGLRTFRGGKLRMLREFGHDMLPLTNDKATCLNDDPGKTCFKAGDGRSNIIISVTAIHTIFAREHNRIAEALAFTNPRATDEQLFQEARRILIAELQHIVYNEYLPSIIGVKRMERFNLMPAKSGYSHDYSDQINPALTSEFSIAFRMGHSTVDGKLRIRKLHQTRMQSAGNIAEVINIPDVMFNTSRMHRSSFYDQILNTLLRQPMQQADRSISHGLSRHLFRGNRSFGLDLAAINIQRSRDMGVQTFNDYRELIGRHRIENFENLSPNLRALLSKVYRSPDEIDLWVGGLMQKPTSNGIVGEVFAEIIADQFSRFKRGDRYFYEYNKNTNPGAFNLRQLQEIRKVTMARLLCDNADNLHGVPPLAFVRADFPGNEPVLCDNPRIPVVNLGVFEF